MLLQLGSKVYGIGYNPNKNKKLFYNLGIDKRVSLKNINITDFKKIK